MFRNDCARRLLGIAALMTVATASAQQTASKSSVTGAPIASIKPGTVSGRVFAITGGGDLKPARLAKVTLILYFSRDVADSGKERQSAGKPNGFQSPQEWLAEKQRKNWAGEVWSDKRVQALTEFNQRFMTEGTNWSPSLACREELLSWDKALSQTRQWALDEKKTSQIVSTEADEEGKFSATVPPGVYSVLVRGRAGFYEAAWLDEGISVNAGTEIAIKLPAPQKSCQSVDNDQPPPEVTVGIVEALIGNGDLIPARFAKIFVLPTDKAASLSPSLQALSAATDQLRAQLRNDKGLAELECTKALIQTGPMLLGILAKLGAVVTDADEAGEFRVNGLRADQGYTVYAIGRAGMNVAVWQQELTPSNRTDRVKLAQPQIACYDPDGFFKP